MKKLYILAALLMATTSAHAGGITIQINGERVRVEAPRNCSGISCIKITSPNNTISNCFSVANGGDGIRLETSSANGNTITFSTSAR